MRDRSADFQFHRRKKVPSPVSFDEVVKESNHHGRHLWLQVNGASARTLYLFDAPTQSVMLPDTFTNMQKIRAEKRRLEKARNRRGLMRSPHSFVR